MDKICKTSNYIVSEEEIDNLKTLFSGFDIRVIKRHLIESKNPIQLLVEGEIVYNSALANYMIGDRFPNLEIFEIIKKLQLEGKTCRLILEVQDK